MAALFVVYLLLLTWLVLWKLGLPCIGTGWLRMVNLLPFAGAHVREVLLNAVVFIPFGAYGAYLWPGCGMAGAALGAGLYSLAMEALQYALAVGRTDVTDVLVNTAGALLGAWLMHLAAKRPRTKKWMPLLFSIGTVLAVAGAVWFALHVRYREAV